MTPRTVRFTADVIRPDGSDTCVYGDTCEPGHGATLEQGWWDPDWTLWDVSDDPAYALTLTYVADHDPDDSPARWLAGHIAELIPAPRDNGDGTWHADDSIIDYRTGIDVRPAAHASGFTTDELSAASAILTGKVQS